MPNHQQSTPTTILHVNDNDNTRYLTTRILRREGFNVIEAKSGTEAIRKAFDLPDLILLDVRLPDIHGFDVCKMIRREPKTAKIAIIHLSAHVIDSQQRAEGLDAGADAYLTQPVDDELLVATINTVLKMRRAESDLRFTVGELEQEKILKEIFVLTLAHDLKSPLSSAQLNTQLILRQKDISPRVRQLSSSILNALTRTDKMITNLLDVSRIRAGEKLPLQLGHCDLVKLAEETLKELSAIHGNRLVLMANAHLTGLWSCDGMKRVIENLVTNAIKYGAQNRPVTLTLADKGEEVQIQVHNEGHVLSLDEKTMLFEPFRRSAFAQKTENKGWGLGLTLVRGIVDFHGGQISVESKENQGTTFTITMPKGIRKTQKVAA